MAAHPNGTKGHGRTESDILLCVGYCMLVSVDSPLCSLQKPSPSFPASSLVAALVTVMLARGDRSLPVHPLLVACLFLAWCASDCPSASAGGVPVSSLTTTYSGSLANGSRFDTGGICTAVVPVTSGGVVYAVDGRNFAASSATTITLIQARLDMSLAYFRVISTVTVAIPASTDATDFIYFLPVGSLMDTHTNDYIGFCGDGLFSYTSSSDSNAVVAQWAEPNSFSTSALYEIENQYQRVYSFRVREWAGVTSNQLDQSSLSSYIAAQTAAAGNSRGRGTKTASTTDTDSSSSDSSSVISGMSSRAATALIVCLVIGGVCGLLILLTWFARSARNSAARDEDGFARHSRAHQHRARGRVAPAPVVELSPQETAQVKSAQALHIERTEALRQQVRQQQAAADGLIEDQPLFFMPPAGPAPTFAVLPEDAPPLYEEVDTLGTSPHGFSTTRHISCARTLDGTVRLDMPPPIPYSDLHDVPLDMPPPPSHSEHDVPAFGSAVYVPVANVDDDEDSPPPPILFPHEVLDQAAAPCCPRCQRSRTVMPIHAIFCTGCGAEMPR